MMLGEKDAELKPMLLDGTYAIMKSYTKPYASCRYTHPSVEAAIHLRSQVSYKDVEEITVKTYDLAVSGHEHTEVKGSYSAKMSIPYATAVGLIYGKAGLQEFSKETVKNEEVLNLARKITVFADENLSTIFPDVQAGIVTIKTKNGEYTHRVDFPKGEPENPLTDIEFKERYNDLMEYADVPCENYECVFDKVYEKSSTVKELMKNL